MKNEPQMYWLGTPDTDMTHDQLVQIINRLQEVNRSDMVERQQRTAYLLQSQREGYEKLLGKRWVPWVLLVIALGFIAIFFPLVIMLS